MSGDSAGSPCGLTALLPMSCRGRAAAFARDLHSRLRNLGTAHDEETESSRLAISNNTQKPTSSTQRELDTFFDYEIEYASPSSPVEEFEPAFERSPTEEQEPPFYDVPSEPVVKEQTMLLQQQLPNKGKNGFRFSTAFYTDFNRPVKLQPVPRENGHMDRLFSPITFEGCVRQNSQDEVDNIVQSSAVNENDGFSLLSNQAHLGSTIDSDSEFESAKSDPSECIDEAFSEKVETDEITDTVENLSLLEIEVGTEDEPVERNEKLLINTETEEIEEKELKVITTDVLEERDTEKETTSKSDVETSLLSTDTKVEDQDEDDRPQRVRRCSSLKTGKTPPGTPGRKKIVRFADVLGLDLADVKTFMDEIPVIPKSAYDDLTGCDVQSSPPTRPTPRACGLTLAPLFQLPRDFTDKLEKQNVCLESARVCDGVHVTICGSVRVRNLDFHKTVHIRYTMNKWKTYTDLQANYVQGSCDGFSDRFQFILYTPCISSGQRLEIAVRFQCKGQQFWDNNSGANYCFDCLALGAAAQAPAPPGPLHPTVDWHPSFY